MDYRDNGNADTMLGQSIGYGDAGDRDLNKQLLAGLKHMAPALTSLEQSQAATITAMRQLHEQSLSSAKRQEAVNAVTAAFMEQQVQALASLTHQLNGHETRLEQHRKQADNHEVRLQKLETLLIPKQRRVPPPPTPGDRAFAPAAARAPSKVHVRDPNEPDGWCRLSVPARELLRSAAFARLKFGRVFYGALGTKPLTSRPLHLLFPSLFCTLCLPLPVPAIVPLPRILYTRSLLLFVCC